MSLYSFIQRLKRATIQLAYRLRNGMKKLARLNNHVTFLIRCRNHDIIPKGLRVSLPLRSKGSMMIATRTSQALLCQLIRDTRFEKIQIVDTVSTCRDKLSSLTTQEQQEHLREWSTAAAERVHLETKTRQKTNFNVCWPRRTGIS